MSRVLDRDCVLNPGFNGGDQVGECSAMAISMASVQIGRTP